MGSIGTNDVVTNATSNTTMHNGRAVILTHAGQIIALSGDPVTDQQRYFDVENQLTNKNDEITYYELPSVIDGGGITPTPTITTTPTPTPTITPTPL